MHRDLKLENILCEDQQSTNQNSKETSNIIVKLTDFGFATRYDPICDEKLSPLGSPHYMAPEVIRDDVYDHKVDVWAVGIIAFILLCGRRPFNGIKGYSSSAVYRDILESNPNYDYLLRDYSKKARIFIKQCLQKRALLRPSAAELLLNDWVSGQEASSRLQIAQELEFSANLMAFAHTTIL